MKKICSLFIIFMAFNVSSASAETVGLSTYYPAPFGVYDRLRLVPKPAMVGLCQVGTMYVETPDILWYCMDNGAGPDAGAWGFIKQGSVWTQQDIVPGVTAYIYPTEMAIGGPHTISVGIGTTVPAEELHVAGANDTVVRLEETVGGAWTNITQMGSDGESRLSRSGTGGADVAIKPNGDVVLAELTGANVGIGTAAPISKLDVNGDIRLLPDATWRGIYWGTDASAPRLRGNSTAAAMLYQSGHDTVTELSMRDKQDTLYGILRGSGDGRYFGLFDGAVDGASHWFLLYDDDPASQFVDLRSGTTDAVRMRVRSADTGGADPGRIDVRIGGPGAVLDNLRLGHTAAAPSGYYATYAP